MLKRLIINGKKIPVPVPVKTLAEAVQWLESALVPPGHSITRMALDNRAIRDIDEALKARHTLLNENSQLVVRIDAPVDLAVQTLEAMRNMAAAIEASLKPLAVELWQAKPAARPKDLESLMADTAMLLDLEGHATGLVEALLDKDRYADPAAVQGTAVLIRKVQVSMQMARQNSDWRALASLLLNRYEPLLKELVTEAESLQLRVLSQQSATSFAAAHDKSRAPTG